MSGDDSFASRWSRRKVQARSGEVPAEPLPAPVPPAALPQAATAEPLRTPMPMPVPAAAPAVPPPLPTLEDVARLSHDSDFSRFVLPGVDDTVKNAAMKKLFSDPHFNVMDGLDTYIDDYGIPDPIPEAMLRRMTQSKFLRLFDDDPPPADAEAAAALAQASPDGEATPALPQSDAGEPGTVAADPAPPAEPEDLAHEDTDLRLQQDDAAGRPGPDQGPGA